MRVTAGLVLLTRRTALPAGFLDEPVVQAFHHPAFSPFSSCLDFLSNILRLGFWRLSLDLGQVDGYDLFLEPLAHIVPPDGASELELACSPRPNSLLLSDSNYPLELLPLLFSLLRRREHVLSIGYLLESGTSLGHHFHLFAR